MNEDSAAHEVDAAARGVRQGAVIQFSLAVWLADATRPLTKPALDQATELGERPEAGSSPEERVLIVDATYGDLAMVVSQSCDLARTDESRQFLTICPIRLLPKDAAPEILSGSHPRLIEVSWAPEQERGTWVADLSVVTTLERSLLVGLPILSQTPEAERRGLASRLARFWGRPALPDDVNHYLDRLTDHAEDKHDKDSPLGRFMQRLQQIRLTADHPLDEEPPWALHLLFVVDEQFLPDSSPSDIDPELAKRLGADAVEALDRYFQAFHADPRYGRAHDLWRRAIDQWLQRLRPTEAVQQPPTFQVLSALTPSQFAESDVLDLGYLSIAQDEESQA